MSDVHNDIVVTGLAAISAAGVGVAPLRDVLRRGESMLQPVPADIPGESGHLWGRAEAFKAADFMPPLKARKFDRCSLFAVVAAGMALKDADVETAAVDAGRIGIALGCGFGGIANSEEFLRGYFTAGGLDLQIDDGRLRIAREGKVRKFTPEVEHVTFSGRRAQESGQDVLYVTERCVIRLEPEGLTVVETAPGVDLQRDVLNQADVALRVSPGLRQMDDRLFRPEPMRMTLAKSSGGAA